MPTFDWALCSKEPSQGQRGRGCSQNGEKRRCLPLQVIKSPIECECHTLLLLAEVLKPQPMQGESGKKGDIMLISCPSLSLSCCHPTQVNFLTMGLFCKLLVEKLLTDTKIGLFLN